MKKLKTGILLDLSRDCASISGPLFGSGFPSGRYVGRMLRDSSYPIQSMLMGLPESGPARLRTTSINRSSLTNYTGRSLTVVASTFIILLDHDPGSKKATRFVGAHHGICCKSLVRNIKWRKAVHHNGQNRSFACPIREL